MEENTGKTRRALTDQDLELAEQRYAELFARMTARINRMEELYVKMASRAHGRAV